MFGSLNFHKRSTELVSIKIFGFWIKLVEVALQQFIKSNVYQTERSWQLRSFSRVSWKVKRSAGKAF